MQLLKIPLAYLPLEKGGRTFEITKELTFTLSDNREITIPKGFKTDLSSVPSWLWSLIKPMDSALIADIIHDYLWKMQETETKHFKGSYHARKFADNERLLLRNKLAPTKKIKNYVTHYTIRLLGGFFYSRQIKIPN